MTKKMMISLTDKTEQRVRREIRLKYYGVIGGQSILFENALREYLDREDAKRKASGDAKND